MKQSKSQNGIPPISKNASISGEELAEKLKGIIGKDIHLSGKPRTDGAMIRKIITEELSNKKIELADSSDYKVVPPKKKGVPKLISYLADSFIVTTGTSYNLQIWNRIPNSKRMLIRYANGEVIRSCDINCIMVKVDTNQNRISSVVVASPKHIERVFGKFGVPTIKYQAIINPAMREKIVCSSSKSFIVSDSEKTKAVLSEDWATISDRIADNPKSSNLLSIEKIASLTVASLVGSKLDSADTKTRGQSLERRVATLLGYSEDDALVGEYPDIPNQALEVKVQDSSTIDLGKKSPCCPDLVFDELNLTTEDVRYLIALTNPDSRVVEGVVIVPGCALEDVFTMVDGISYKCQRNIPMDFFRKYNGQSVFNPEY